MKSLGRRAGRRKDRGSGGKFSASTYFARCQYPIRKVYDAVPKFAGWPVVRRASAGRPDLSATMDGNRHGPAIGMVPPLVASGLSMTDEAELAGHPLELPRGGARHS